MKKILMSIATVNLLFAANAQLAPEGTNWFDATSGDNVIISGKSNNIQGSSFNTIDGNENQLFNNAQYNYLFGNRNLLNTGVDNYVFGSDNKDNGLIFTQNKVFGDSNIFQSSGNYQTNYVLGNSNIFSLSTVPADTITNNNYIIGSINNISGSSAYVFGWSNIISGSQDFAIGFGNNIQSTASNSFAFGANNNISTTDSFAFGRNNIISSMGSMGFGYNNTVSGANSFAFGSGITVTGNNIGDFGNKTLRASGSISGDYDLVNKSYLDSRLAGLSAGGVDAATVDSKIATASTTILNSANGYADTKSATTLSSANTYTDNSVATASTATLNTANIYTDTKVSTSATSTLNSANGYTDTKVAGLSVGGVDATTVDSKIATASTTILNSANTYTDTKVSNLSSGGVDEATVDAKISTASTATLNSANSFTNGKTSMISQSPTTTSFTKVSGVSGNEHGLYITDSSTKVTGGTTSSSMTLNDVGATFAEVSTGNAIKVSGVATGTADTDAANTKQVTDAKTEAISTAKSYIDTKSVTTLTSAQAYADSVGATTLTSAKNYTDTVISSINGVTESSVNNKITSSENKMMDYTDSRVNSLEQSLTKEYRSATATAIALGVSPILSNGNKNALGLGFGNYEGENAVAINYVAELDKNTHLQLGTSLSSANQGFKAGVSFGW